MVTYKVANDNGNSEHKIIINGQLFRQPNVNVRLDESPWEHSDVNILPDLMNNLCVSINSHSCITSTYYVGKMALNDPRAKNMNVNQKLKHQNQLPVVNTLAIIAAKAVLDGNENVTVDMATALPATYWDMNHAKEFKNKFEGKHQVTVHVGSERKDVQIIFDTVTVIPEAYASIFELHEMYPELKNSKVLILDIGDGTTDTSILQGKKLVNNSTNGIKNGAAFPIEIAFKKLKKTPGFNNIKRQYVEEVIKKTEEHKAQYYDMIMDDLRTNLANEADEIKTFAIDEMDACRNEFDALAVIGGGSILMKEHLESEFLAAIEERNKSTSVKRKLYYLNEEKAPLTNVLGLDKYLNSAYFDRYKELSKNNG